MYPLHHPALNTLRTREQIYMFAMFSRGLICGTCLHKNPFANNSMVFFWYFSFLLIFIYWKLCGMNVTISWAKQILRWILYLHCAKKWKILFIMFPSIGLFYICLEQHKYEALRAWTFSFYKLGQWSFKRKGEWKIKHRYERCNFS